MIKKMTVLIALFVLLILSSCDQEPETTLHDILLEIETEIKYEILDEEIIYFQSETRNFVYNLSTKEETDIIGIDTYEDVEHINVEREIYFVSSTTGLEAIGFDGDTIATLDFDESKEYTFFEDIVLVAQNNYYVTSIPYEIATYDMN